MSSVVMINSILVSAANASTVEEKNQWISLARQATVELHDRLLKSMGGDLE